MWPELYISSNYLFVWNLRFHLWISHRKYKNQPTTKLYYQYLRNYLYHQIPQDNYIQTRSVSATLRPIHDKMLESQKSLQRFKNQEKL